MTRQRDIVMSDENATRTASFVDFRYIISFTVLGFILHMCHWLRIILLKVLLLIKTILKLGKLSTCFISYTDVLLAV